MCAYAHRPVSCAGPTSPPHPGRLGAPLGAALRRRVSPGGLRGAGGSDQKQEGGRGARISSQVPRALSWQVPPSSVQALYFTCKTSCTVLAPQTSPPFIGSLGLWHLFYCT